jgi:hypothetical protein
MTSTTPLGKESKMNNVMRSVALAAVVTMGIAACGGAAPAPSSSSVGSNPPASAAVASSTADQTSAPAASSSQGAASSVDTVPSPAAGTDSHADPSLENELPSEISGTAMRRYSVSLADLLASGAGDRAPVDAFLKSIGKSESDGSIAAAFDPTNVMGGGIFAYRITGADPAALLQGITSVEAADLGAGVTMKQATVSGKNVSVVSVGTGVNDTEWIYGRGDIVFVVHATDEAHAAPFLQALS